MGAPWGPHENTTYPWKAHQRPMREPPQFYGASLNAMHARSVSHGNTHTVNPYGSPMGGPWGTHESSMDQYYLYNPWGWDPNEIHMIVA